MDEMDKIQESVEFFTKIAEEAFIEHVPEHVRQVLDNNSESMWKSGYLTAYVEFQKAYNTSSKN